MSAQEREGFGVVLPANPDIEGIKAAARAEQALADMVESHPESDTRGLDVEAREVIEAARQALVATVPSIKAGGRDRFLRALDAYDAARR